MNPEIEKEINCIGLHVMPKGQAGSVAYAKVQARSNPRAWFIPLSHRQVTTSGLALFQPLLKSAAIMKAGVHALSNLGLTGVWARNTIYLAGNCNLSVHFPNIEKPAYAIFSGTESPHRKMAVQVMDQQGRIAGFAKLGSLPGVPSLLYHEASMLEKVASLGLRSANTPTVLYVGPQKEATLLVTDTLKTAWTRSPTRFTEAHKHFLVELAETTRQPDCAVADWVLETTPRIAKVKAQLAPDWEARLEKALSVLSARGDQRMPCCMSHGDFTPWNTFMAQDKLYVFDWEYAEERALQGNDLIHFTLNQPQNRNLDARKQLKEVRKALNQSWTGLSADLHDPMITIYLLTQVLRQLERMNLAEPTIRQWDGIKLHEALFDQLLYKTE